MSTFVEFAVILPLASLLGLAIVIGLFKSFKIVQEYERAVIFRLGRLHSIKGPGLFMIIPILDVVKNVVDLRIVTLDVSSQEAITKDNVTVRVSAVIYFRVVDPAAVVVQVKNYWLATANIAQTTLRDVIGQSNLDELLSGREEINRKLQAIIDQATKPWGVKVRTVEMRDVELPETMQRAMAKQAEAEREKRATVIHASGELAASGQLAEAAEIMSHEPASLQLRYLQTLTEVAAEKNSTILFPVPLELLTAFMQSLSTNGHQATMTIPSAMVAPNPADREEEKERNGSLNQALLSDKRFSHN